MYDSPYAPTALEALAKTLVSEAERAPAWCVFDNTRLGAATTDALALKAATSPAR